MKIRKSLSISDTMLEAGNAIMSARRFDDFSEMVSALIREELDRRGLPGTTPVTLSGKSIASYTSAFAAGAAQLNEPVNSAGAPVAHSVVADAISVAGAPAPVGTATPRSTRQAARRKATPPAPDSRKKAL